MKTSLLLINVTGARELRKTRVSEAYQTKETTKPAEEEDYDIDRPLTGKEIGRQLKALFTNPAYILLCLTNSGDNIIISGFTAFGPKYIELQYNMPAGQAGALFGKFA